MDKTAGELEAQQGMEDYGLDAAKLDLMWDRIRDEAARVALKSEKEREEWVNTQEDFLSGS